MIEFIDMHVIEPTRTRAPEQYDVVISGNSIDARGQRSLDVARASGKQVLTAGYDTSKFQLVVGPHAALAANLAPIERALAGPRVLLDATSLNAVELLLLARTFLRCEQPREVGFLYAEPERYIPRNPDHENTPFAFAQRVAGEKPIPGFAHELRHEQPARLVACLGFEPDRLNRILGDDESYFINQVHLIFGIPPYRTSWEMHALLPHAERLSEQNIEVAYAGANNPRATYRRLCGIAQTITADYPGRLVVAPIGSTPSSIGVALFSCCRDDIRVKFDFPTRAEGMTEGVGPLHRYLVARQK